MNDELPPPRGNNRVRGVEGPAIGLIPDTVERPFWSVMVPTYKPNTIYLEKALRSVLEQAPGPEEMQIELIDDGSTDFDPQLFLHKVGWGSRVSFYRQPRHRGIGGNWNTCIERARGHWIHLLHQDDLVLSGFYRQLREGVETDPNIGAAFCHHFFINSEGHRLFSRSRIIQNYPGILSEWLEYVFVFLNIMTPSIIVKRSVYEQLGGFDVSFDYALDWDMWKRIAAHYAMWFEPEPLAGRRSHGQSTTRRLIQTGNNIAEIRRSIETSKCYLPEAVAADMATRASDIYTRFALRTAVKLLLRAHAAAAFAQFREAQKFRSGTGIKGAIIKLSLDTLRARLRI